MLGVYEDFPESYHSLARFSYGSSSENLQKALVGVLYRLNLGKTCLRPRRPYRPKVRAFLEFGIADGVTFGFIDRETWALYRKSVRRQSMTTLDLLCIARYYVAEAKQRRPLRFDYYLLRFLFSKTQVELRVFHEKGTQRISADNLIAVLVKKVNREMYRKGLGRLRRSRLHVL